MQVIFLIISMIWCRWKLLCTGLWSVAVWLNQGNVTLFLICVMEDHQGSILGYEMFIKHPISILSLTGDEGRINSLFLKAVKNTTWYWTFPKNLIKTHRPLFLTSVPFWAKKGLWKPAEVRCLEGYIEYLFKIKKQNRLSNCLFGEFYEMLKKTPSLPKTYTCTLLKKYLPREHKCFELSYCDFKSIQVFS